MDQLAAYHELLAYTAGHGDEAFIHQHVVDAFAAQTADEQTKPIKLVFALVGLCLHIERQFTGREVQRAHQWLARRKRAWPRLVVPENRGVIHAADVFAKPHGEQRDRAIHDWTASVWEAFRSGAPATVAIVREFSANVPK